MAREGQNQRPSNASDGAAQLVRSRSSRQQANSGEDIELQNASGTVNGNTSVETTPETTTVYFERGLKRFLRRFKGEGRVVPTWSKSAAALLTSSGTPHVLHQHLSHVNGSGLVLNILFIFIPISWVGHFVKWTPGLEFTCEQNYPGLLSILGSLQIHVMTVLAVCLLAITALEKMTDFVGENFALYLGKSLGDLVVISLDKSVHHSTRFTRQAHTHCQCRRSHISDYSTQEMRAPADAKYCSWCGPLASSSRTSALNQPDPS